MSLQAARSDAAGSRRLARPAPALVGALLVVPSLVWACLDSSIWPWDQAFYGQRSIALWATLRLEPRHWPGDMVLEGGSAPPAIEWLGQFFVPLGGWLGSDETALLLSIVLAQAACAALVFAAARRLVGGRSDVALAAPLLLAAAPLFVALGHNYFVESIQATSVAWALFVMVSARRWPPALTVAQAAGALTLGLAAKVSTPLYLAGPLVIALASSLAVRWAKPRSGWWRERRFLASSALAAALACPTGAWYALHFRDALRHAHESATSTAYGTPRPFASHLGYWSRALEHALFLPYWDVALAALLGLGAAFLLRRRAPSQPSAPLLALSGCAATGVAALAFLATQTNEDVRFVLPVAPAAGVALVAVLGLLESRAAAALAAAVLAAQFAAITALSFDDTVFGWRLSLPYLAKPDRGGGFGPELERVAEVTCTEASAGQKSVVGVDYPWLNATTLGLYAYEGFALEGRRCDYTKLRELGTDVGTAWRRLVELAPPYYVAVDYGDPRNRLPSGLDASQRDPSLIPFNSVDAGVFRRVARSGRYAVVAGSRRSGIVVFERRGT